MDELHNIAPMKLFAKSSSGNLVRKYDVDFF